LKIARDEAGRENRRETERLRVHAHYISGAWTYSEEDAGKTVIVVENLGPEPVTEVDIFASHWAESGETLRLATKHGPKRVLLPGKQWFPDWKTHGSFTANERRLLFTSLASDLEIKFTDVGGTRWRRVGERPPVHDLTGRHAEPRP
jgi:hypothetical protein